MNEQKLSGMLGFAVRARQAASGMEACRILIRSGKCGVVLTDAEAAPGTRKKTEEMAKQAGTPFRVSPPGLIIKATGKDCMVIAIRMGSFAEQIISLLSEQ